MEHLNCLLFAMYASCTKTTYFIRPTSPISFCFEAKNELFDKTNFQFTAYIILSVFISIHVFQVWGTKGAMSPSIL